MMYRAKTNNISFTWKLCSQSLVHLLPQFSPFSFSSDVKGVVWSDNAKDMAKLFLLHKRIQVADPESACRHRQLSAWHQIPQSVLGHPRAFPHLLYAGHGHTLRDFELARRFLLPSDTKRHCLRRLLLPTDTHSYARVHYLTVYIRHIQPSLWTLWFTLPVIDTNCVNNSWVPLVYINNIYHPESQCAVWTWFLANDFQFFIAAPFLIGLIYRYNTGGLIFNVVCVVTSCISAMVISYKYDLKIALLSKRSDRGCS
ncbi:hypothetical protein EB796_007255 [Bugula neritina]|uniref:Uncharacterized protein n=1 Tax=Bugula neritina TaxID=10212 RepID=A0A7J7KA52_BUGNE|nr:hypothetical protein EB796_007255 [Bugula neritina]